MFKVSVAMNQKGRTGFCVIICFCLLLLLGGCAVLNTRDDLSQIIDGHTFIDDMGQKVEVNASYKKIITLYSAHTENLFTLGAEDKVIGVDTSSTYPPPAAFLPRYDYKGDPEPVIAAQPDLVIIRPFIARNYPDFVHALKNAGLKVIALYPATSVDFEKYVRILAMLTGTEEQAQVELDQLKQRIAEIQEKVSHSGEKPTVFFEATEKNYRTVTVDSNPARAIELAGGMNIADDVVPMEKGSTIAEYGIEKIMQNAENIDVYMTQRGAMNSGGSIISINQRQGFKAIKAVKEGRILELNEKIISSPNFRYYKGVQEIARMLYPDIMDDYSVYDSGQQLTREAYAAITVMFSHVPVFIPSSSHYYETKYYNHTYGLFEDVAWTDPSFDFIETAVMHSFIKGYKREDGTEYFEKEGYVTREDLAFTLNIMGDFTTGGQHKSIADLNECKNNKEIVQKIVDSGIMTVDGNQRFNPQKTVSAHEAIMVLESLKKDSKQDH